VQLPPAVEVDLDAIGERHGLRFESAQQLTRVGIFNTVYALGDHLILRVPRDHPVFVEAARKELLAVPAARAAGVRTPAIVVADDACDLVPVPYAVYERAHGESLEAIGCDPEEAGQVWRELGRDLGLLHTRVERSGPLAALEVEDVDDARALLEEVAAAGNVTTLEVRWLEAWLEALAPSVERPLPERFVHGDSQASNVMARRDPLAYEAVLDWGGCGWASPVRDLAGFPLRAVPHVLEGYRETAPAEAGDGIEARVLWRHLQLALYNLRRPPQPGLNWAERPATMLVDILRFFAAPPRSWSDLAPPSAPRGRWQAWNA
jgi:aminoglycoside phosphotransferase (APT) family kinase protein